MNCINYTLAIVLLFVAAILVPSLLAVSLCVVMLWRWRHHKDPLPPPARTALNRTFRRNTHREGTVLYKAATDGKPVNNELHSQVRSALY